MSINGRKSVTTRLGAAVAAVAAPAMLLLGAGNAHADPANNNVLRAWWDVIPEGLHAHVQNKTAQGAQCNYSAYPGQPFIAGYRHDFYLPPGGTVDWVIPGVPTGTGWQTNIHCPGIGQLGHIDVY